MFLSFIPPKDLLHLFRSRAGTVGQRHAYAAVKKWEQYSEADRQRILQRLQRFSALYLQRYREGGLLSLPLRYTVENGTQICVEERALPGAPLPAQQVHTLEKREIDLLFKTLLMQLRQLESLQFVHGAISPDTVRIHKKGSHYVALVTDISAARFRDEPAGQENIALSAYMTPEANRMQRYPSSAPIPPETDIYSAGCLYYQYLTGRELSVGESPLTPSEAACAILPVALEGLCDGFRSSLIRWMLMPYQGDRPKAADVLSGMAEAEEKGLAAERSPGEFSLGPIQVCSGPISPHAPPNHHLAYDAEGKTYLARILHDLWPCGDAPRSGLFLRQQGHLARTAARMTEAAQLSREWHRVHAGIDPCFLSLSAPWPVCYSPLAGQVCIPLRQLCRYNPSVFLLDARMTELLLMAHVLHSADYILGVFSENSFYASISETGAQAHFSDAASALSLFSIPPASDLMPDADAVLIMSPEMSSFISSQSDGQEEAYQLQLSPASDIFTLGLLYHLILTGRFPQVDADVLSGGQRRYGTFSNALCHAADQESVIVLDPSLDRKHSRLIRRMISLNPLDRPANCEEIASQIMRFYTE